MRGHLCRLTSDKEEVIFALPISVEPLPASELLGSQITGESRSAIAEEYSSQIVLLGLRSA